MPESVVVTLNLIVTFMLFQPLAFAAGARLALTVGAVLSMLTRGEGIVATLPALSVTVTVPLTPWPSAVTVSVFTGVLEATPDRLSDVVKLKERSVLFQPLLFAAGLAAAKATVGGVLSSLTLIGAALVVRPAAFVQDPLKACPAVSVVCCCGSVHFVGSLILSDPVGVTVTLVMYHPVVPSVPVENARAARGPDLSSLTLRSLASV